MRVVSVIPSFPDNSIVIGKAVSFFENEEFDYYIYCWASSESSWKFWGKYLKDSYKSKIVISAVKKVRSLQVIAVLIGLVKFILFENKLFHAHREQFKDKSLRTYLVALLDDYELLNLKPDILHFEFGTFALSKLYLKEVLKCKTVVSFRGYDINYYKLDEPKVYDKVWQTIDGFHFLGNDLLQRAKRRGFDEQGKIVALVPPAIYPELFVRSKPLTNETDIRPIDIISVGRLVWKKGVQYALIAFKKFLDMGGAGTYHIVGDGPTKEEIQFTAFELGIEQHVIFHGRLKPESTREKLEAADVFLHPSISEGFCNAVIEAQAMEIPVICTDADGLPENIVDGETGYLVPKWDAESMAHKMFMLYNNPGIRYEFGKNGRKRVLEHFTVPIQSKQFVDFYKRVYEY